jgi:hypothetical protein
MYFASHFNANWLNQLINNPYSTIEGQFGKSDYVAKLALPNYSQRLLNHYGAVLHGNLSSYSQKVRIPYSFKHFGVIIDFIEATELELHDAEMVLDEGLRQIIARTGPLIIRNAYMVAKFRDQGHRNRFPHLNFHIDRSENQPTQYSMYTRNPFDPEQQYPRTSSTLFIPSIVGNLQAVTENQPNAANDVGIRNTYTLFNNENMKTLLGDIVLEHGWDRPEGVGEISMLDNRTALHASYYRNPAEKGYKIGVRYLA